MAENTPKITFLSNKPVIVTLKFDEPQTGQNTGKDGKPYTWYRYGVSQKGIDRSGFKRTISYLLKKKSLKKMVRL